MTKCIILFDNTSSHQALRKDYFLSYFPFGLFQCFLAPQIKVGENRKERKKEKKSCSFVTDIWQIFEVKKERKLC